MLIYRLMHFYEPIPDIDIGLDGRDKEICKPLLQLFHNTESYNEIRSMLQVFLNAKNQKKSNLIDGALYPIIVNLVSAGGKEVYSSAIWAQIKTVYFDANNKSQSGKFIPLTKETEQPHQCQ